MCHIERSRRSQSFRIVSNNGQNRQIITTTTTTISTAIAQPQVPQVLSPFRRVAKSARVNLNKYWGILSSKIGSPAEPQRPSKAKVVCDPGFDLIQDFTQEIEDNRINELIELRESQDSAYCQSEISESQNSLNEIFEENFYRQSYTPQPRPYKNYQNYQNFGQNSQNSQNFVNFPSSPCPSCYSSCPSSPTSSISSQTSSHFTFPNAYPTYNDIYPSQVLHSESEIII